MADNVYHDNITSSNGTSSKLLNLKHLLEQQIARAESLREQYEKSLGAIAETEDNIKSETSKLAEEVGKLGYTLTPKAHTSAAIAGSNSSNSVNGVNGTSAAGTASAWGPNRITSGPMIAPGIPLPDNMSVAASWSNVGNKNSGRYDITIKLGDIIIPVASLAAVIPEFGPAHSIHMQKYDPARGGDSGNFFKVDPNGIARPVQNFPKNIFIGANTRAPVNAAIIPFGSNVNTLRADAQAISEVDYKKVKNLIGALCLLLVAADIARTQ